MKSRAALQGVTATAICAVAVVGLALPSEADFYNGSYTATASASLIGIDFTTRPGIAFDQLVDAGVSEAQAQIDGLGTTNAFASDQYPSTSVVGLPGLAASAGVSGIPAYPLIASSSPHTPKDHKSAGTITLDAASEVGSSKGTVTDGATIAVATTTFDSGSKKVSSVADSQISSLNAGDEITISGVHTKATMTVAPDGTTQQDSSFTVSSLTILGQRVTVSGTGLSIAGTELPLGVDPNTVLAPLLSQLSSQGVTITFLPAIKTAHSITSGGLKIDGLFPVPQGVIPSLPNLPVPLPVGAGVGGLTSAVTEITLGRATASVTSSAFGSGKFTDGSFTSPPVGASRDTAAINTATSSPGSTFTPAAPDNPSVATVPQTGLAPVNVAAEYDHLFRFYPILFFAALVGLSSIQIIRRLGVRNP